MLDVALLKTATGYAPAIKPDSQSLIAPGSL
ncbi:hypothetical protein V474_00695 [Novosphingobium barchaimii LL02]|uniref:Uncharacterized protein n=1 Tax=Novosphingobium barchaimii LL02 TaxID=1114963 RepID=A0A0J7Y947_9SPHN|nr:hypothetical protein V474_00695 [Novosphingobium barchaimii LL02]